MSDGELFYLFSLGPFSEALDGLQANQGLMAHLGYLDNASFGSRGGRTGPRA